MSDGADFVSDLNNLPEGVVTANAGAMETHRGSDDVMQVARTDKEPEVVGTDAPAEKTLSLREQLSQALKGDATPPASQLDGGAVRNADGTFAPKIETPADPNAPAAAAPGPVQYPWQAGANVPGLTPEAFAALPAETQQHVARTMETLTQQAAQYAAYGQIEQVIAPRRQGWALAGVSEGQVINQLFALSDFAEKDPAGFIQYFASERNLDLEEIAFGTDPVDPTVAAQNERIRELETQLNGFTAQQQRTAHENVVNEIVQFADEKGADGKTLLRPYFAELGQSVLPFIQQSFAANPNRPRAEILAEGYEAACWANPAIRTKLLEAQAAAAEAKRIKDQTEAASRARTAGVSLSSGTPGEGAQKTNGASSGSLRDDIRASLAAAT